jgi:citrate synthase
LNCQASCFGAYLALTPETNGGPHVGLHKSKYWEPIFEDSLNLLGKLPGLAAAIYRNTYKDRNLIPVDARYDWAANLAIMMGLDKHNAAAMDMMRMYQTIHAGTL